MVFELDNPWLIAFPFVLIAIGVFLLVFYAMRLRRWAKHRSDNDEGRIPFLEGWAGGCLFIAGALVFVIPIDAIWLCVVVGICAILSFFPVAALIDRLSRG